MHISHQNLQFHNPHITVFEFTTKLTRHWAMSAFHYAVVPGIQQCAVWWNCMWSVCGHYGVKLRRHVFAPPVLARTPQVNSALHPSGVAKSSTSFGWGKGGKVTSAGWQVTLCDLIWHVISRSGVVISITNCYIRFTYFTYLLNTILSV